MSKLFIISGPSGSGKDTIMKEVFARIPQMRFSISSITRPMRPGEKQGDKYNFVSREEFERMISEDKLLEYNIFNGYYYGTPTEPVKECIKNGEDMLIEVDVNGALNIRKVIPENVSIFLMPPSMEELEQRLINRKTDSPEAIKARLLIAKEEIKHAEEFDFVVINDKIDDAVDRIVQIINDNK